MTTWTPVPPASGTWSTSTLDAFQDDAFQDNAFQDPREVWTPVIAAGGSWTPLAIACLAMLGALLT